MFSNQETGFIKMTRQFKFFMIPAASSEEAETELNLFLASHRPTMIQRELVADGKDLAEIFGWYEERREGLGPLGRIRA